MKRVESPSSINTFKQCRRKYYYQYIEKLPSLPNIHQVRGNIAHSTLEKFYDIDVNDFTENDYKRKFTETLQKLFLYHWKKYHPKLKELGLSRDQEMFYFEETMLMLMNWNDHFLNEMEKVIGQKELAVQEAFNYLTPIREQRYVSENYSVQGFIDAIHNLEEEVHIIDYKTNSSFEVKDEIRLQLAIYSLLYQEKHGSLPSKVGIFFLRHKLKFMDVDEELLELARKEIELIHAHTSATENIGDYPCTTSPLCKWSTGQCDFYETCRPNGKGNGKFR